MPTKTRKPPEPKEGHFEVAFTRKCGRIGLVWIPKGSDDQTRAVLKGEHYALHADSCPEEAEEGRCLCEKEGPHTGAPRSVAQPEKLQSFKQAWYDKRLAEGRSTAMFDANLIEPEA